MNNPPGVSPSKGIREPHEVKRNLLTSVGTFICTLDFLKLGLHFSVPGPLNYLVMALVFSEIDQRKTIPNLLLSMVALI